MNDDKKRDRALQRRVRERQAKTGESYQDAWRHLAGSEAPDPSSASDTRRVPLSLSTGTVRVLPGQSAQITARPQLGSFWPDRLLIKNADRWDVHQLAVNGNAKHSLVEREQEDAPDDWSSTILWSSALAGSAFSLDTWHPLTAREVPCGESVVLIVEYIGKNEQGEYFEATLFGWEGLVPAKSTKNHDTNERISERAISEVSTKASDTATVTVTLTIPTLFVDRLTIADAKDWVVNDILERGKSILVQAGDLPGEMFSASARVILEPLAAGDSVEVKATYVGSDVSARLAVELSGTATAPSEPCAVSYFLPMSTGGTALMPTQSAHITGRPPGDFLPERLVIADPDDWIVDDIKVGIRCQLAASGGVPGQSFSGRAVGGHVTLDLVRRGQDFIMVTTRGEDCEKSAPFFCGVQGRLV
jgi:hypothetical protein